MPASSSWSVPFRFAHALPCLSTVLIGWGPMSSFTQGHALLGHGVCIPPFLGVRPHSGPGHGKGGGYLRCDTVAAVPYHALVQYKGGTGPWHGDSLLQHHRQRARTRGQQQQAAAGLVPSATDLRVHMDRAPAAALLPTAACEGRPCAKVPVW